MTAKLKTMKLPADVESALRAGVVGLRNEIQELGTGSKSEISALGAQPVSIMLDRSFASLEAGDLFQAERSSQLAVDICWEKLNSGYWRNVCDMWRTLYSYAALACCLGHVMRSDWKDAMKWVDMALLMGTPLPRNALTRLASVISRRIPLAVAVDANFVVCFAFSIVKSTAVEIFEVGIVVVHSYRKLVVPSAKEMTLQQSDGRYQMVLLKT